ncbi:MAG: hypothetical protein AB8F94_20040 [Saprospiraceae bacterium]
MKTQFQFLIFFLFFYSNIFAQQSIQFALVDLDSIKNYLMNQIKSNDKNEKFIYQEGQLLVENFSRDIRYVQKLARGGCMNAKQMKEYETYLLDFQNKIVALEKSMNWILEKRRFKNQKNINSFLNKKFSQFGKIHQCQIVPQKGVLFQKKENPNVTFELISFIQNSKEFLHWSQSQYITGSEIAYFYMQLFSIRLLFKNYQYKWVRERWD